MPTDARIKKRLTNKALHYLGRYASTTARLRQTLQKFAKRKLETAEPKDIEDAIEAVIADCQKFGYIDDQNFIDSRIRAGRNAGQSERRITQKLLQAGIGRDMAQASLKTHRNGYAQAEWLAALVHIRKKRLGCYGSERELSPEAYQKQMAKLARAGFGLDIIKQILSIDNAEEAENLEAEYRHDMPL